MKLVILVADAPKTTAETVSLAQYSQKLGPLPAGVAQVAGNVWLVDVDVQADFIRHAGAIAGQDRPPLQAYSTVP